MLGLSAAILALASDSPPVGPPTAKYVVIYANHDRADCDNAKDRSNTAHYFNATPGLCVPVPPKPNALRTIVDSMRDDGKAVGSPPNAALQFAVTTAGVNIIVCSEGDKGPCSTCSTWHKESAIPFGECDVTHQFTLDMAGECT